MTITDIAMSSGVRRVSMSVKVRNKRNRLYLDINIEGRRNWQALNLTLSSDSAINKETMRLAEFARAKREQQIFSGQWGLQDKISAKMTLYAYLENMGEGRDRKKYWTSPGKVDRKLGS